jgi:hypothetical protein
MIGVTLLTVPTIVFGGLTLLGILSSGAFGVPGPEGLSQVQYGYYRAGHAHAGVLLVLSLVLQVALDHARLAARTVWVARVAAPLAPVLVSAGFFGIAHIPGLGWVLYAGVFSVVLAAVLTGVGLLRRPATLDLAAHA